MANPHRGEVGFTAGDDSYVLSFSANAMCELEDAVGKGIEEIVALFTSKQPVRLSLLRTVFWQGLLDHHPDLTLDDTKRILKKVSPSDMGRLLGEAFVAAMPSAESGSDNPPAPGSPADGTGPAS